jgi:hypothetical protein
MPYRLDTYDAMASIAVTSDASTNRRSVATPTPSGVHLRAGWSADPKVSWPLAPADVFGDEVLERKHGTAGRRTPAYTPSEPALHVHRLREGTQKPAVVRKWEVGEVTQPTR